MLYPKALVLRPTFWQPVQTDTRRKVMHGLGFRVCSSFRGSLQLGGASDPT